MDVNRNDVVTNVISFDVLGHPQGQGSKVAGVAKNGRRFVRESNKSLPGWRQLVADAAQRVAPERPFEGAIELVVEFFLPVPKSAPKRRRLRATKRPDSLKLCRAIEDAMSGVIYRDDAQIVRHVISKELAYDRPVGARIAVEEVG